jgi:hypothetical protein
MDAGYAAPAIDAAIDALASVSKCSVRQVDLWALVDDRVCLKDDFEAVRRLNLTLAECRTIMHQYHRVRAIIGALEQIGVEQGWERRDPVSPVLIQHPRPSRRSSSRPTRSRQGHRGENGLCDGFLVYALAEHA